MYQVTVHAPDGAEAHYSLGDDQGLVVGREPTCDVVLPSKKVSRRHARLFTNGDRLHIEDLGSQNGVFVGGARLSGTSEIRPGPAIEVGEFKIKIKKVDPHAAAPGEGDAGAAGEGHLEGQAEMAGQTLHLPAEPGFVGRDPGREVQIDNDSVSRKHAEVRLEPGSGHVVVDLASSNGTFVNGERLKPNLPRTLKSGDQVRFGETTWQYVAGPAKRAAGAGLTSRQKLLIAVAALLLVLVIALVALHHPASRPARWGQPVNTSHQGPDEATLIAQGQQALRDDRFVDAKRFFTQAWDLNPLDAQTRMLVRTAEGELHNQQLFNQANTKIEMGRDQEAVDLLTQISTDSGFFARSRLKVQELVSSLMQRYGAQCHGAARDGNRQKVLKLCPRYLDYACQTTEDEAAVKALRKAEKATRDQIPWTCPSRLAPWLGSGTAQAASPKTIIERQYHDKDVREAVEAYVNGNILQAQQAIGKVKNKNDTASEIAEALTIVSGKYKEGDADSRAGDQQGMLQTFTDALTADQQIVPTGVTSWYGQDMRTRLAQYYATQGQSSFDQQSYTDAYSAWSTGLGYDPQNKSILDGMTRLEHHAEDILDSGPGCDGLRTVMHITSDSSSAHQQASATYAKKCQ